MPQRVAVIGAGMVGLPTAWFLQQHGLNVTVYERRHVAAGSSWGNAGWLTPAHTAPLPEPAVLSYGVRAVLNASSPVYVPLNLRALAAFDELTDGDVDANAYPADRFSRASRHVRNGKCCSRRSSTSKPPDRT